jgi:hypothetical protein
MSGENEVCETATSLGSAGAMAPAVAGNMPTETAIRTVRIVRTMLTACLPWPQYGFGGETVKSRCLYRLSGPTSQ